MQPNKYQQITLVFIYNTRTFYLFIYKIIKFLKIKSSFKTGSLEND